MAHDQFSEDVQRAADLHESGDLTGAIDGWRRIVGQAPSDMDRSIVLINLATTLTAAGRTSEAEGCWDQAIATEGRWFRHFARAHKAAWLSEQGRAPEAIEMFRTLATEPWLNAAERRSFESNVALLEGGSA